MYLGLFLEIRADIYLRVLFFATFFASGLDPRVVVERLARFAGAFLAAFLTGFYLAYGVASATLEVTFDGVNSLDVGVFSLSRFS